MLRPPARLLLVSVLIAGRTIGTVPMIGSRARRRFSGLAHPPIQAVEQDREGEAESEPPRGP